MSDTNQSKITEIELDALFDTARAATSHAPDGLMARVVADAQMLQPHARVGWRSWLDALGGVPTLGGLVTATCVGVWIGVMPPESMPDFGGLALGYETTNDTDVEAEVGGFGWDIGEG